MAALAYTTSLDELVENMLDSAYEQADDEVSKEEIDELGRKILLLKRDRKAHYESRLWAVLYELILEVW
jgi:hypothetical protein